MDGSLVRRSKKQESRFNHPAFQAPLQGRGGIVDVDCLLDSLLILF